MVFRWLAFYRKCRVHVRNRGILLRHGRFSIPWWQCSGLGCCIGAALIPGLGAPICHEYSHKKKKKKECPRAVVLNPSCILHSLKERLKISLPLPFPRPIKSESLGIPCSEASLQRGRQEATRKVNGTHLLFSPFVLFFSLLFGFSLWFFLYLIYFPAEWINNSSLKNIVTNPASKKTMRMFWALPLNPSPWGVPFWRRPHQCWTKQAGGSLSVCVTCYGLRLAWAGSRSLSRGSLSPWAASRLEFRFGEENQRHFSSPNSKVQLPSRCRV